MKRSPTPPQPRQSEDPHFERQNSAYRATHYQIASQPPLVIHIDQDSPRLAELLAQNQAQQAALISADNPHSQALSPNQNRQRRHAFQARLKQHVRYRQIAARHIDPTAQWPDEHSRLLIGIPEEQAIRLAEQLQQNALVLIDASGRPRLHWLRRPPFPAAPTQ